MVTTVITQSNYIPWKGYFDQIAMADVFVILDSVQYTRRDWRNRNLIKTPFGPRWLTVPLETKGNYKTEIDKMRVSDSKWWQRHLSTFRSYYNFAYHFERYEPIIRSWYEEAAEYEYLCDINKTLLQNICRHLGIKTVFKSDREFELLRGKSDRLISICKQMNATHYLAGPRSQGYLDVDGFNANGIEVGWLDYSNYPDYRQQFGPFDHGVSIIDLLFNEGDLAPEFMKFRIQGKAMIC